MIVIAEQEADRCRFIMWVGKEEMPCLKLKSQAGIMIFHQVVVTMDLWSAYLDTIDVLHQHYVLSQNTFVI